MTDEQILQKLQSVLDDIHNEKTGIFRNESPMQKAKRGMELIKERNVSTEDGRFSVSGKEIYEEKLGDFMSCTGMTKVFLYAARNTGLDLKAVITTSVACLDAGKSNDGHVVPAVKMSDGQYHIFEPRCKSVRGDFLKMLKQPVKIGGTVFHVLNSIKDKPYEVIDIISQNDLEQIKTMRGIILKSRRKNIIKSNNHER